MRKVSPCKKCGSNKIMVTQVPISEDFYNVKCYCEDCGKFVISVDTESALKKWEQTRSPRANILKDK